MEEQLIAFTQRMPKRILEYLDEEAARKHRSRTGQINQILEERYGFAQAEDVNEEAA